MTNVTLRGGHGCQRAEVAPVVEHAAFERLPDGSIVAIRPIEAADAEGLRRLFYRLSPRTVYLRFFSPISEPSDAALRYLAGVDHDRRQALVALHNGEIVGVARYDRDPAQPDRAEVAVVVEDAWQGRGVGPRLLTRLGREAARHGVAVFTGSALGENQRALSLARHLVASSAARLDHGEWMLEIPLR